MAKGMAGARPRRTEKARGKLSENRKERLRESEERFRAIASQTTVGMARTDLKGQFLFVNHKLCEMLGYDEAELIGRRTHDVTHPDDVAETTRLLRGMAQKGVPFELEKRYLRKDGSILWASVSASTLCDAAGKPQSTIGVILDISKRKEVEAALQESRTFLEARVRVRTAELIAANKELQNEISQRERLERELLEVSDREQRRLGQDLHDGLCQHLAAVAFMARAIAARWRKLNTATAQEIDEVADLVNEGVAEARNVARGLHPVQLEASGLMTALEHLVAQRHWSVPCRLEARARIMIADNAVALHLYRIAREAVINASKHAHAREIIVRMDFSRKGIVLSVTDDGIGIPRAAHNTRGMGLHIMDYRAHTIGAKLEVKPGAKGGTQVICVLPVK